MGRRKEVFMATPRRPDWKDAKWSEAKKQQKGGIVLLLDHIGAKHLGHEQVTVALWRHLQSLTIAVEGELVTSDSRLMGRLDLLFADVDEEGQLEGWLVADLKTGNAPTEALKPEVNRQLRMYRDILLANNPAAPPVRTEGWYTKTATKWAAEGESVLEQAYAAWEATQPTTMPMDPTPGPTAAEGSATGRRGALTGGRGANQRAPFTRATSATLWSSCIATRPRRAPPCWSCANRSTSPVAPFPPASRFLHGLTDVEKRSWRPFETAVIRARCSLARS